MATGCAMDEEEASLRRAPMTFDSEARRRMTVQRHHRVQAPCHQTSSASQAVKWLMLALFSLMGVDCKASDETWTSGLATRLGFAHPAITSLRQQLPTWWLPFPQHGSVEGGSTLTIFGTSFDAGEDYTLHFWSPQGLHDTASVPGGSQLEFPVPSYNSHETTVTLTLSNGQGVDLQEAAAGHAAVFEYRAAVTSFAGTSRSQVWFPPTDLEPSRYGAAAESRECLGLTECDSPFAGGPSITVRGVGFEVSTCTRQPELPSCTLVKYMLIIRGADNTLHVVSATAQATDTSTIIFILPTWPYISSGSQTATNTSGPDSLTSMTVMRGNNTYIQTRPAYLTYRAEIVAVSPITVQEWDVLHIHGLGFSHEEVYYCALSRPNSTGYTWLAEERAYIQATFINISLLLCPFENTTLDPTGVPGYTFPLYLAGDKLPAKLTKDESFVATPAARRRGRGWGAFFPYAGEEIQLCILMLVNKTRLGQVLPEHVLTINSQSFVPLLTRISHLQTSRPHPSFPLSIRALNEGGMWLGANVSSAPAVGGTPIELEVFGLQTGDSGGTNILLNAVSANDVLSGVLAEAFPGQHPYFPGIMFDLFAKRHINFEGLDFAAVTSGEQRVWVYVRDGGFDGHASGVMSEDGWRPLNDGGTIVNAGNSHHATVNFAQPARLTAGATYGVLLISAVEIRFSETGTAVNSNVQECCATYQQSSMSCCLESADFSDGFVSIRPAKMMMAQANASAQPLHPERIIKNPEDFVMQEPVLFAGAVRYGYDEFGPEYQCRFQQEDLLGHALHSAYYKNRALPLNPDLLSVSTTVTCVVPSWHHVAADYLYTCSGSPAYPGVCADDQELESPCGGMCQHGSFIPAQGTCSGTCSCNFLGVTGRPVCSGGAGSCSCLAPNTNSSCTEDSKCDGGGECVQLGRCSPSLLFRLYLDQVSSSPNVSNLTIPLVALTSHTQTPALTFSLYSVWTSLSVPPPEFRPSLNGSHSHNDTRCDLSCHRECDEDCVTSSGSSHSNYTLCMQQCRPSCGMSCSNACQEDCVRTSANNYSSFTRCKHQCQPFVLARGGETLLVTGNGFDVSFRAYQCQFAQFSVGSRVNSSHDDTRQADPVHVQRVNATVHSSKSISCVFPLWNYSASESGLHLASEALEFALIGRHGHSVHYTSPDCGRQLPYPYSSCIAPNISVHQHWYGVDPPLVAASLQETVQITGAGFHVGSQQYECWFHGRSTDMIVSARVARHDSIFCQVPLEAVEESDIQLHLLHHGFKVEQVHNGMPTSVSVYSSFRLSTESGGAEGGTVVRVKIYGIPRNSNHTYRCSFRNGDTVMPSKAVILGDVTSCSLNGSIACVLQCSSPPFGLGNLGSLGLEVDGISTELSILRTQQEEPEISLTRLSSVTGSRARFFFFSTLSSMSPTQANATGGQEITLHVNARVPERAYVCRFSSGESEMVTLSQSVQASAVNSVVCVTPFWGDSHAATTVNVSLSRVSRSNCTICGANKTDDDEEDRLLSQWDLPLQQQLQDLAPEDTHVYAVPTAQAASTAPFELTFLPLWIDVTPKILQRNSGSEQVNISGWGFSSEPLVVCRFHAGGVEYGRSNATVVSTQKLECRAPHWQQLPFLQVEVQLELIRDTALNLEMVFAGSMHASSVFVLSPAAAGSVERMLGSLCCSGACSYEFGEDIRIPQGQNATVTFLGAQVSPYSYMALASNESCSQEHLLSVFPLFTSESVRIENDLNFTGRAFVCYSSSGAHSRGGVNPFKHQLNKSVVSIARASSSSITKVVSARLGGQQPSPFVVLGVEHSCYNYLAIHQNIDDSRACSWNESSLARRPWIIPLHQEADLTVRNSSQGTLRLPTGAYRICYTTSGSAAASSEAWVLQALLPDILVINSSLVVTSVSPTRAAPGVELNVSFAGVVPSVLTAVALAPHGQCMNQTARHAKPLAHSVSARFLLSSSGMYYACHSTDGLDGQYVQQAEAAALLDVIPMSHPHSITQMSPLEWVAEQTVTIKVDGFYASSWSYLAMSDSANCEAGSFIWISPRQGESSSFEALQTSFDALVLKPGRYTVCFAISHVSYVCAMSPMYVCMSHVSYV
jgi:hypothetical protein